LRLTVDTTRPKTFCRPALVSLLPVEGVAPGSTIPGLLDPLSTGDEVGTASVGSGLSLGLKDVNGSSAGGSNFGGRNRLDDGGRLAGEFGLAGALSLGLGDMEGHLSYRVVILTGWCGDGGRVVRRPDVLRHALGVDRVPAPLSRARAVPRDPTRIGHGLGHVAAVAGASHPH
jgi:hypothetical protein